ncbi:hypothetical protein LRS10_09565 [Phenylobacterium sp. J426]|uniref:hypothetical protein n=1 Tax=Phenylobacterium sp. J426 TaxID=2898439 RepID=UPI0021518367|nr:hypothetical protein [Phenylobacterium sp. J426]MCR5874390.1 hypothetical protein [Phenylobacterium sp. J426]
MGEALMICDARELRLFELSGDGFEPALRRGDMLMVATADGFTYDGDYLLEVEGEEAAYRASARAGGEIEVWQPNPKYTKHRLSREVFARACRGIVVAEIRVRDRQLIQAVHAGRRTAREEAFARA